MKPRKSGTPPDPRQQAMGLLVRREQSRSELARKLKAKGAEVGQVEATLDELQARGFQDDDRFAQSLARTRAAAGYGPQRIRAELGTHGIEQGQIEAALDACEVDWDERACDVLARRYAARDVADPGKRNKALAFLLRRGFDLGASRAAIAALAAGASSDRDQASG